MAETTCLACGTAIPATGKPGRPRSWCFDCLPTTGAAGAAQWRALTNYNATHAARRRVDLRGRKAFGGVEAGTPEDAYLLAVSVDPCAYCGAQASELDHIEPGIHDIENVVAACRSCNARKGRLPLLGYLLRRQLLAEGYDDLREQWQRATLARA